MNKRLSIASAFLTVATLSQGFSGSIYAWEEPMKVTYEDHIKPIMREHCTSCHNSNDKKSGLALDSYEAILTGGSGGEVVYAGEVDSSRLYGLVAHEEQPFMPPNQDMIARAKVDLIKTWIEQGMPENSGSEIKKAKTNTMALAVTLGRPEGAPPMPQSMLKQTPFASDRAATISALAASPWAPLVAVGGQRQVALYHSETGELQGILPFPEGEPQSITFSRDGKLILVGGGRHSHSGYAALYDIATGDRITRVGDELDIVMSADINDTNTLIALAGPQKLVRVYDTLTGELKYEQKKHTDWIYSVRFSPDGLLLASADRSAGLVVWEADTGRLYLDLQGHKGEVRSIAWRPDSAALVSASMDGTLKMWEMNEGTVVKSWDAHRGGAMAIDICNDGTMVSTGADNKVKVWDIGGNAAGEMPDLVEAGHEATITVDGKQIAAGDWAGNVRLWQRADPSIEKSIPANPPTLETMVAAAQVNLDQATTDKSNKLADYNAKNGQLETLTKEISDLQASIAKNDSELAAALMSQEEIKPKHQALLDEINKLTELSNAISNAISPKQKLISLATENRSKLEKERETLISQTPADETAKQAHQLQIETLNNQVAIQTTANEVYAAEIKPKLDELNAAKTRLAEIQPVFAGHDAELKALATKVAMANENKNKWNADLTAKTSALPALTESVAQAKQVLDAADGQLNSVQAKLTTLQADLARFNSRAEEIANRKATLEQTLAERTAQVPQTEAVLTTLKTENDSLVMKLQEMEAQLKAIQTAMAEVNTKKAETGTVIAAKQEELNKLQEEVETLESDIASAASMGEFFQEAYAQARKSVDKPVSVQVP